MTVIDMLSLPLLELVEPERDDEEYRLLLSGSRHWPKRLRPVVTTFLDFVWHTHPRRLVLWHGDADRGVDVFGRNWADMNGVEQRRFPADWDGPCRRDCKHMPRQPGEPCKAAGHYRNAEMVKAGPDALAAFIWCGSNGTTGCVRLAKAAGVPTYVFELSPALLAT